MILSDAPIALVTMAVNDSGYYNESSSDQPLFDKKEDAILHDIGNRKLILFTCPFFG